MLYIYILFFNDYYLSKIYGNYLNNSLTEHGVRFNLCVPLLMIQDSYYSQRKWDVCNN